MKKGMVLIGRGGHAKDIRDAFGYEEWWGDHRDAAKWCEKPESYVIGINDSATRVEVAAYLEERGWRGVGVVIMPNVYRGPEVRFGRHTHINFNAGLTRCTLGDFVTVGPGAVICGDVTIGDRTMIGAGAVVSNLVRIGSDVTVGAGAVVINDVPDGATVVGVPAREKLAERQING